jgi:uncharacterized protein (TIGR02466 family)
MAGEQSDNTSDGKFTDLFPLSVYRDRLGVDADRRRSLAELVLADEQRKPTPADQETAWLGDTSGHEFLFEDPAFESLFQTIAAAVKDYATGIGMQTDRLNFYFQRSWATVSREGQRIFEHAHLQSHISFAYYLQKGLDAGGIYFSVAQHPNELAEGLFTLQKSDDGILAIGGCERSLNRRYIEPVEDEIIIFPSKTLHSTAPNMTATPRISISADIVVTLKDSGGHETLMPPVERWQRF